MSRRILLFNAPYGDFTYPYHSLSYLLPVLKRAGFDTVAIDLNALWFRSLFRQDVLNEWAEECLCMLSTLETQRTWSIDDQREAVRLMRTISIAKSINPRQAIEILTSERFYNYKEYLVAQHCIRNFERVLEYVFPTYPFFTAFAVPPGEPNATSLLAGALGSERLIASFQDVLREHLTDESFLFCGMSAPFYGNLRLGFAALEAVQREFPGTPTVAGGTAVTDMVKNIPTPTTLQNMAAVCNYVMVGEADDTIADLACWFAGSASSPPDSLYDLEGPIVPQKGERAYIPLSHQRMAPDHSWVEWSLYLSPERQVNYSPTRGCFWNKCTFCDYGLNVDLPTAPYRNEDDKITIQHLSDLCRSGIRHVYLAVDAVSPSFLRRMANGIVENGIAISWSGEFFLTQNFTDEFVQLLEQSGLITASFGFESGSSRVLELMGKGRNRVEQVYSPAMRSFGKTKIGLQPKFFFGFPGETNEERWETVRFLKRHQDVFSIVTSANIFELTSGAIVAKLPEKFGLRDLRRPKDHDICGALDYCLASGAEPFGQSGLAPFNAALNYFHPYERPWVGGIDTFHSKLYIERYGRQIFHSLQNEFSERDEITRPWVTGSFASRFDIDEVFERALVSSALEHEGMMDILSSSVPAEEMLAEMSELAQPLVASDQGVANYQIRFC